MKRSTVLWGLSGAVAATLLAATLVSSQPPATPDVAPPGSPAAEVPRDTLVPNEPPLATTPLPSAPAPKAPPAATIDDLLAKLDTIKAQKAALEKAEKETVATLVEKLKQQRERIKKLGVPLDGHDTKAAPETPSPISTSN
jgi:hypothetical protein